MEISDERGPNVLDMGLILEACTYPNWYCQAALIDVQAENRTSCGCTTSILHTRQEGGKNTVPSASASWASRAIEIIK